MIDKNKKILITGASGFIGSNLTELLIDKGFKLKILVHYNSFNSLGNLKFIDSEKLKKIEIIRGDINDYNFIEEITKDINIIFHLAALIAIPYSYNAPSSYFKTNIIGTNNILEAAKKNKVKKIIHTSTSEVYGDAQYSRINENHPICAQSPYSASKIGADIVGESYFNSFNLPVTTAIPFNCYGPRQSLRSIIPSIISQALFNKGRIKVGNTYPKRDFTYVEDTCNALISICGKKNNEGKTYNIGSGKSISIDELIKTIGNVLNIKIKLTKDRKRKRIASSEVDNLLFDNKFIKKDIKWIPKISLNEGIKLTSKWIINQKEYKTDKFIL